MGFLVLVYLAGYAVTTWPWVLQMWSRAPSSPDQAMLVWGFWWMGRAVETLRWPFITEGVLAPVGAPLAFHVFMPLFGLLSVPLQWMMGPFVAYNLVTAAVVVLAGLSTYALARDLSLGLVPSLLAGFMYAFAPAVTLRFGRDGHLPFAMVFWIPLVVLLVRRLLRDPNRRNATLLGAAMAGALLSDLTIAIYALLVGTAYLALQLRAGDPPPGLLRCLLGSVLVFTLVSSPLLAAMGHSAANGALWEAYEVRGSSAHSLDVGSFFIAGRHHPVLGPLQEDLRSALHRKGVETGYLGLIIVALAVLGWGLHRRQRKAQDLAWLAAAALLLSLGPRLLVLGRSFVPLPIHLGTASEPVSALMPYTWVQAAPVLANLRVPSRTLLVAALPLALLAALAVQRLLARHGWMKVGVWAIPPLVLFEALSPMPTHISTTLPPVYRMVAQDPDDSAIVVDVPLGFRTGLTTIGRQTGPPLIYAVGHGKRVAVGMVSRLPLQRIGRVASIPLYRDLILLQSPFGRGKATQIAPTEGAASAAAHNLKYVVVRLDVPELQAVRSYLEAACFGRMGTGEKFELFRFEC